MKVQVPTGIGLRALGCTLALIVMITAGYARADACEAPPASLGKFDAAAAGTQVPEVPYLDGDGNEHTLAEHQGQGLVVNFWATWCAPCVEEMPALDALNAALEGSGIRVLTVSADFKGADAVRPFFARNGIETLPVLVDKRGRLVQAFGAPGLPTTILVGADGREKGRVLGVADWDDADSMGFIKACLGSGTT